MKKIAFSEVLRTYIAYNAENGPFSNNFKMEAYLEELTSFLKEEYSDFEINYKNGLSGITAIIDLNNFYNSLMKEIKNLLDEFNLSTIEISELVLQHANFEVLNAGQTMFDETSDDNSILPKSLNEKYTKSIKNVFGDSLNVQDAIDTTVDVCNEAINIIYSYKTVKNKRKRQLEKYELRDLIIKFYLRVNLLYILKNAFEYVQYEFGYIQKEKETIQIKNSFEQYSIVKRAGKERDSNQINEYVIGFPIQFIKPKRKISSNVRLGSIDLKTEKDEIKNLKEIFAVSTFFAFYEHVKDFKLQKFYSITIDQVLNFIAQLQSIFLSIPATEIISSVVDNQDISFSPSKIEKKKLIDALKSLTNYDEKTIQSLLNALSQPFSPDIDLWKKPLLAYGSFYYFSYPSVAHGHFQYLVDYMLNDVLFSDISKKNFEDYLKTDILKIDNDYKFEQVSSDKFPNFFKKYKHALIYETMNYFILFEVCLFPFALNSKDYNNAIDELGNAAEILTEKRKIFLEEENAKTKTIISIITTQYPLLSGLDIDNCFVLDKGLLNNYFNTGELRRGKVINDKGKQSMTDVSSFKYYSNEEEFNSNFVNFCVFPEPIKNIVAYSKVIDFKIGPKEMNPQLTIDSVELISTESKIWIEVRELEYLLKQLFYFDTTLDSETYLKDSNYIDRRLRFLIPNTLHSIATINNDRFARIAVLEVFKKVGTRGFAYLMFGLQQIISNLRLKLFDKNFNEDIEYDVLEAEKLLQTLLKNEAFTLSPISLSKFSLNHNLTEGELAIVKDYIIGLLSVIQQKYYNNDELNLFLKLIVLYIAISPKEHVTSTDLYKVLLNYIDTLNYNYHYQAAKDFSEEILEFAFTKQFLPTIGWLCLFKCFSKLNNIFDTAFYGSLFISCLDIDSNISEDFLVDSLYYLMLFYRNSGFGDMAEQLYKVLQGFKMNEYDEQKITISYFNNRLKNYSIENFNDFIPSIISYLKDNLSSITAYGNKSIMPWLALLYNIRNLENHNAVEKREILYEMTFKLEEKIDNETISQIKSQYFPIEKHSKQYFREAIINVFATRYFDDLAYELDNLELPAKNVLSLSLEPIDINNLLLCGLVLNDQNLSFVSRQPEQDVQPFLMDSDNYLIEKINDYSSFIFKNLQIKEGQLIIWAFNLYNDVYLLSINSKFNYYVTKVENWEMNEMEKWLSNISNFFFDSKDISSLNQQELDYSQCLDVLKFATLPIGEDNQEILFYSSLRLSKFPHNLYESILNVASDNYTLHEQRVRNTIEKNKSDFISFNKPISNIISLEWYAKNGTDINIAKNDFSLESWMPISDGDIIINLGYEKLKPIIEDKLGFKINTELVPQKSPSSVMNVFMAHGDKGIDGFKTVYTKQNEGTAYIKEEGIEKVFGTGIIAVLFVCHSASITQEVYAQKLNSFTNHILSLGYRAVIAPAWGLNPDITSIWLEEFISNLFQSNYLNVAVYKTNLFIATQNFDGYDRYYSPTAWAAMHLFGNPNIIIK